MRTLEERLWDINKCPHCNSVQGEIVQGSLLLSSTNANPEDKAFRKMACTWCQMGYVDNFSIKSMFVFVQGANVTDNSGGSPRVRRCPNCTSRNLTEDDLKAGLLAEQDNEDLVLRDLTCGFCGHNWQDKLMLRDYDVQIAGDPAKDAWG